MNYTTIYVSKDLNVRIISRMGYEDVWSRKNAKEKYELQMLVKEKENKDEFFRWKTIASSRNPELPNVWAKKLGLISLFEDD